MTAGRRIVVIGGDAAGMTAASQARRLCDASTEIVAFERGPRTSWAACGLPYLVEGLLDAPDDLVLRTPEEFARRGIDVHIHHEVTAIDTAGRTVTVRDLASGAERVEPWDDLVIGTGATGIVPPLPGIDADGVHQIRTLDDTAAIEVLIDAGARNAVVVGGGYIGIEAAEALAARGLSVTMIEMADTPMAGTLDADMGERVAREVHDSEVDLRLGSAVRSFATTDGAVRSVETDDASFPADLVVIGLGSRPNTELAADSGICIGSAGGIAVDDHMRTSADGVWAGGDCVENPHRITGKPAVIPLGTHANKHGRIIGTNLSGGDEAFPGVIGTAITKFGDTEIARAGISEREASDAGIEVTTSIAESSTRAGYYPGAAPIAIKIITRTSDRVMVGAQVVGGPEAGKRIDALATAIWAGMTVDDFAMADLSYAPPFSPVWDPTVYAAGRARSALAT